MATITPQEAAAAAKELGLQSEAPQPSLVDENQSQPVDAIVNAQQAAEIYKREVAPNIPKVNAPSAWGDVLRGVDNLQQIGGGLTSFLGDITGLDSVEDFGDRVYQRNKFESSLNPAQIGSFENIHGLGDLAVYGREAILENAPLFLPSLVTGGAGSIVGKKLATELFENLAAKVGEEEAAKQIARRVVISKMFTSPKAIVTQPLEATQAIGEGIGATTGAYASSAPMEVGSIYGDAFDESGNRIPGYALVSGAVAGILDALPEGQLLQKVLGKRTAEKVATGFIKRLGIEGAQNFLKEGSTEALQTVIEESGNVYAKGEPIDKLFDSPRVNSYIDAFLKGGMATAPGSVISSIRAHPNPAVKSGVENIINQANQQLPPELQVKSSPVEIDPLAKRSEELGNQINELELKIASNPGDADLQTQRNVLVNEKLKVDDQLDASIPTSEDQVAPLPELQELDDLRKEREQRVAEADIETNPELKTVIENRVKEIDARIEQLTTPTEDEKVTAKESSSSEQSVQRSTEPSEPASQVDGDGKLHEGGKKVPDENAGQVRKTAPEVGDKVVAKKRKEIAAVTQGLVNEKEASTPEGKAYVESHRAALEPYLKFLAGNGIEVRVGPKSGKNKYYSAVATESGKIVLQLPQKEVFDARNKTVLEKGGRIHDEEAVKKILEEEVIHAAVYRVIKNQWEKTKKTDSFAKYAEKKMEAYGSALRNNYQDLPLELAVVYGNPPKPGGQLTAEEMADALQSASDKQLGTEFLRTVIQRVRTGQATEDFIALHNMKRRGVKTALYNAFMDAVHKIYASVAQFISDPKSPKLVKDIYENATKILDQYDIVTNEDFAKSNEKPVAKKAKKVDTAPSGFSSTREQQINEPTLPSTKEEAVAQAPSSTGHEGDVFANASGADEYHSSIVERAAQRSGISTPGEKLNAVRDVVAEKFPEMSQHLENIIYEIKQSFPDEEAKKRISTKPEPIRGQDTADFIRNNDHVVFIGYEIDPLSKKLAEQHGLDLVGKDDPLPPDSYIIDTNGISNVLRETVDEADMPLVNENASVIWPVNIQDKYQEALATDGIPETKLVTDFGPKVTPDTVEQYDEHFGKNNWIIKYFGDNAGKSQMVFFAESVKDYLDKDHEAFARHDNQNLMVQQLHNIAPSNRVTNVKILPGRELRVHVLTDAAGNAKVLPFSTFWKTSVLDSEEDQVGYTPLTIENPEIRSAHDRAIQSVSSLPFEERNGQFFGTDIIRLNDGSWGTVELNPVDVNGQSGFFVTNPLSHEAYIAGLLGRRPLHAELADLAHEAIMGDGGKEESFSAASDASNEMQLEFGHADDFIDKMFRATVIPSGEPRTVQRNENTNYWNRSQLEQQYLSRPRTETTFDALRVIREIGGAKALVNEIEKNWRLESIKEPYETKQEMLEIAADIVQFMAERMDNEESYVDTAEEQDRIYKDAIKFPEYVAQARTEHGRAGDIASARTIFTTRRTTLNDFFNLYKSKLRRYFGKNAVDVQEYLAETINKAARDAVNGVTTQAEATSYMKKVLKDIQDPKWRAEFRKTYVYKNEKGFKSTIFKSVSKAAQEEFDNLKNEPVLQEVLNRLVSSLNIVPKGKSNESEATALSQAIQQVVKEAAAAGGLVNEKSGQKFTDLQKLSAILNNKALYNRFVDVMEQRIVNKWADGHPSPEFQIKLGMFMDDLRSKAWNDKLFDTVIVRKAKELSIKVERAVKAAERVPQKKLQNIGSLAQDVAASRVEAIRTALIAELKNEGLSDDALSRMAGTIDAALEQKVTEAREKWAGSSGAIRKTLKEVQQTVAKVAQSAYVKRGEIVNQMADRFIADMGMSDTSVFPHATTLHDIFTNALEKEIDKKREQLKAQAIKYARRLGEVKMANELEKKDTHGHSAIDRIVKLSTIGAIEDHTVYNAMADKLGLPPWSPAVAKKIADWGEKLAGMDPGRERQKEAILLKNYMESQKGIDWKDMAIAYMYVSMLSGPGTHAVNAFSNAGNLLAELGVQIARHPTRTMEYFKAVLNGLSRGGVTEFKDVLFHGLSVGKLDDKIQGSTILESEDPVYLDKGASTLGKLLSLTRAKYIGRFLQATDMFFYKGAQELGYAVRGGNMGSGAQWAAALSQARRFIETRGLDTSTTRGRLAMEERALTIFDDLRIASEKDKVAWQDAHEYALQSTFNQEPRGAIGSLATKLGKWSSDYPIAKLVVPFTRVVANVINTQLEYSPWGYARWYFSDTSDFNKVAGERDTEIAIRATLGMVATMVLMSLVMKHWDEEDPWFTIYGDGPRDANQKRQLYDRGWRPNTMKVGNSYITYQNTPIALALAALGTTLDRFRENPKLNYLDIIPQAGMAFGKSALNQSFASGVANLVSSLESSSPEKEMQRFASRILTVPVPNIFKQIDAWIDPSVQQSDNFLQMTLKQVPVVRQTTGLKPMLNVFGEPVERVQGPFNIPFANRFWTVAKTDDPVLEFLGKNQLHVPGYSKSTKLGDTQMTDDEYYDYIANAGPRIKKALRDEFTTLSGTKEEMQDRIEEIARDIKKEVRDEMNASR